MKAIRLHAKGGPEQLVYEDAPMPEPAYREVRIRVHAAAITPTELTWDESYLFADGRPRLPAIPGHDVSGVVESIGRAAIGLKVGDEVFGLIDFPHDGSAAEFVCVPAADLAPKFAHARSHPRRRRTAFGANGVAGADRARRASARAARPHSRRRWRGWRIRGATREISRRLHIIATASARHASTLRELGVNEVIDYTSTQFESVLSDIDLVFDTVGGETQDRSYRVLRRGGRLISIAAPPPADKATQAGVTAIFFIVRPNRSQLVEIANLIDSGKSACCRAVGLSAGQGEGRVCGSGPGAPDGEDCASGRLEMPRRLGKHRHSER